MNNRNKSSSCLTRYKNKGVWEITIFTKPYRDPLSYHRGFRRKKIAISIRWGQPSFVCRRPLKSISACGTGTRPCLWLQKHSHPNDFAPSVSVWADGKLVYSINFPFALALHGINAGSGTTFFFYASTLLYASSLIEAPKHRPWRCALHQDWMISSIVFMRLVAVTLLQWIEESKAQTQMNFFCHMMPPYFNLNTWQSVTLRTLLTLIGRLI